MNVVVIDNYDSFTYNLVSYLGALGASVEVYRNDAVAADAVVADAVVISPGPGTPADAGISVAVVQRCASLRVPLLGVCLGMQAIVEAFGGRIERAPSVMHGKMSEITHSGRGVFRGLAQPLTAMRYHSLVCNRASLPGCLSVEATTSDGLVMAVAHETLPIHGVQFHPESILTPDGARILANFLRVRTDGDGDGIAAGDRFTGRGVLIDHAPDL